MLVLVLVDVVNVLDVALLVSDVLLVVGSVEDFSPANTNVFVVADCVDGVLQVCTRK